MHILLITHTNIIILKDKERNTKHYKQKITDDAFLLLHTINYICYYTHTTIHS